MDAPLDLTMLPEVWTEISGQLNKAETLATLADINQASRKGVAAAPGMYVVTTQTELDHALDATDARFIILVRPGLTLRKHSAVMGGRVVTSRGEMTVTGGVLFLVGEDDSVSATVSGGAVFANGYATITSLTGGQVHAFGRTKITSVAGGYATVYEDATVASVTSGTVEAYGHAEVFGVSAGTITVTDDTTIELSESQAGEAVWDDATENVTLAGTVIVTGLAGDGDPVPDTVAIYGSETGHIHGPQR